MMTLLAWVTGFFIVAVGVAWLFYKELSFSRAKLSTLMDENALISIHNKKLTAEFLDMGGEVSELKQKVHELKKYRADIRKAILDRGLAKWHTLYEDDGDDEWTVKRVVRLLDDDEIIKSVLDRRKSK